MKIEQGAEQTEMKTPRKDLMDLFKEIINTGSGLRIRVTGRSMQPFLKGGEMLTIQPASSAFLKRGDLILYSNRQGEPMLHRIMKISKSHDGTITFHTKGDALRAFDEPVEQSAVLGKVCAIEKTCSSGLINAIDMESFLWRSLNYSNALIQQLNVSLDRFKLLTYRMLVPGLNKESS